MNLLKVICCDLFFDLLKKDSFYFFVNIKMSYYWFNRQKLSQKAKEKYVNGGKEKAAKYYQANKDTIKENTKNKYKNLLKEEKKEYSKNRYKEMKKNANLFLQYKNEWTDIKIW